jgi:hypothetical protein
MEVNDADDVGNRHGDSRVLVCRVFSSFSRLSRNYVGYRRSWVVNGLITSFYRPMIMNVVVSGKLSLPYE